MRRLLIATILLSTPLFAQRPVFPDDYKTNACAPANSCVTYPLSDFEGRAASFFGWTLDPVWLAKQDAELQAAFQPACRKHATCFTVPGNSDMFCNDIFSAEIFHLCDAKYPDPRSHDGEQCREYAQVFALAVDQKARPIWGVAHGCAPKNPVEHAKPPEVWMVPESIPYGYRKVVKVYSIDHDTHVSVYARITFEDHVVYAPTNPIGDTESYIPI